LVSLSIGPVSLALGLSPLGVGQISPLSLSLSLFLRRERDDEFQFFVEAVITGWRLDDHRKDFRGGQAGRYVLSKGAYLGREEIGS